MSNKDQTTAELRKIFDRWVDRTEKGNLPQPMWQGMMATLFERLEETELKAAQNMRAWELRVDEFMKVDVKLEAALEKLQKVREFVITEMQTGQAPHAEYTSTQKLLLILDKQP